MSDESGGPAWLRWLSSAAGQRTVAFLTGIALTVFEAVRNGTEAPSRYVLYLGMMGLPWVGSRKG